MDSHQLPISSSVLKGLQQNGAKVGSVASSVKHLFKA